MLSDQNSKGNNENKWKFQKECCNVSPPPVITSSKLTIKTVEQGVRYVQS